jgi:dUTP pyrophosphatase
MTNTQEDMIAFQRSRGAEAGIVLVKRLNEHARLPTYGSSGAAGMDLYANFNDMLGRFCIIPPGERMLIKTGISIEIPRNTYARVAPRSGLAYKNGIDVLAGVIDEDYRGEVGVILINHGVETFTVTHGDRVAQLIIEKYVPCFVTEVTEHVRTERGAGAFGSTGK